MKTPFWVTCSICFAAFLISCKDAKTKQVEKLTSYEGSNELGLIENNIPEGMVWIPAGSFWQGAATGDPMAMSHEHPAHEVSVNGFYLDVHEVTNAQFSKFVSETEYITHTSGIYLLVLLNLTLWSIYNIQIDYSNIITAFIMI